MAGHILKYNFSFVFLFRLFLLFYYFLCSLIKYLEHLQTNSEYLWYRVVSYNEVEMGTSCRRLSNKVLYIKSKQRKETAIETIERLSTK